MVTRYRPTIFGLAFAATGHAGEAEDLTQEMLIAAHLGLSHFTIRNDLAMALRHRSQSGADVVLSPGQDADARRRPLLKLLSAGPAAQEK